MEFGNRLYNLRKNKKLSQNDLAKKLGFSQSSINYWEKGQRTPSIEAARIIADFFDVTLNYLLYGQELNHVSGIPEGKVRITIDDAHMDVDPVQFLKAFNNVASHAHPSNVTKLLTEYFKLNIKGQKKSIEQLKMLAKIPEYIDTDTTNNHGPSFEDWVPGNPQKRLKNVQIELAKIPEHQKEETD